MSVSPVLDESIFEKLNPVPRIENLENFTFSEMKGPSNVSVRLDLFPEHKTSPSKTEFNADEKIKNDDNEISKWNETEQLNSQVVFINPEWDEIEEEKAGISSFLNSITPNISSDKIVPSQVTEFVVTDTESVSSVTVSLDEFAEDSEEIVAVISDSETEVIHAEFLTQMDNHRTEGKSPKKLMEAYPEMQVPNWKANSKSPIDNEPALSNVSAPEKSKPPSQNHKKQGVEFIETSRLLKASCYVMQNGKITKPFYIVKNPVLRDESAYKNINKSDELLAKKSLKTLNPSSGNEEDSNLLALGRNTSRKKENFREPQLAAKLGRNQEFIRVIENPARAKKIIVNKIGEKNPQEYNSKKPSMESAGGFGKNLSPNSTSNSCESEDLMWLLDFKLDDLFSESSLPALSQLDDNLEQYAEFPGKFVDVDGSVSNFSESDADDKLKEVEGKVCERCADCAKSIKSNFDRGTGLVSSGPDGPVPVSVPFLGSTSSFRHKVEIGCQTETMSSRPNKPQGNKFGVGKQHHKMETKSESALSSRTFSDLKCSENRKPPFTYTELIECALQEKGPLTVSEIYNWISETFPYYKSWDDRWKNSVRHNLSINPYFRKGTKARQGSGHLWTVNKSEDNSKINSWKRQRFHEFEEFSKRLRYSGEMEKQDESSESVSSSKIIDETELATASIEDKENRRLHRDVLMAACVDNNFISTNVSLEQSAEEILSGVKKNVEVQYLEPVKSPCENDFLNPISKEILMGECGLLNQIELNLTAETGEHLSIVDSMTDSEHIFGIPDELNFHYDISSHAPQLLPLAK